MLVFVTSVLHPGNARSYDRVGRLLARTLASVCAQTSDAFEVVVVCNEIPPGIEPHPKVHFVTVDFPPREGQGALAEGLRAVSVDKGSKRTIGLLYARRFEPDHIMLFDADDRLSNRLAGFVAERSKAPGWFAEFGHVHRAGSAVSFVKRGFHLVCGSCNILRADLLPIPAGLTEGSSQHDILAAMEPAYLVKIVGGHMFAPGYLREHGHEMEPLPFPGAVWVLGTGENTAGIKHAGAAWRPVDAATAAEFGLDIERGWPGYPARLLRDWLVAVYVTVREAAFAIFPKLRRA